MMDGGGTNLQPEIAHLRKRLAAVAGAHLLVGMYSGFGAPLIKVLQARLSLTEAQAAWIIGLGALSSGLCQPVFSWLTDRLDSRIFGAMGLILAAAAMSTIGLAPSHAALTALYVIGMFGIGIFNPVGAAMTGQLAEHLSQRARHAGLTAFFFSGVSGAVAGNLLAGLFVGWEHGMERLSWLMAPGLGIATVLHIAIRRVGHRQHDHRAVRFEPAEIRQRWLMIAPLYLANAIRFSVHLALVYLFIQWGPMLVAQGDQELDEAARLVQGSRLTSQLVAANLAGMAIGGVLAAALVRAGREKWPLVIVPVVTAPLFSLFAWTGAGAAIAMSLVVSVGFASMIPLTISVAQRLLPHRAGLASGLMLGMAWSWATFMPPLVNLGIDRAGLGATFALVGALLAISGLVCIPLNATLLKRTAAITIPAPPSTATP
jgi:FSR family fosmidomycin resistance protein-like MFS transporter